MNERRLIEILQRIVSLIPDDPEWPDRDRRELSRELDEMDYELRKKERETTGGTDLGKP